MKKIKTEGLIFFGKLKMFNQTSYGYLKNKGELN